MPDPPKLWSRTARTAVPEPALAKRSGAVAGAYRRGGGGQRTLVCVADPPDPPGRSVDPTARSSPNYNAASPLSVAGRRTCAAR